MNLRKRFTNWVGNLFSQSDKKKEEEENNQVPTYQVPAPTSGAIASRGFSNTEQNDSQELFENINLTEWILNPRDNIVWEDRKSILNKAKEEENKNIGEKVVDLWDELLDSSDVKATNANDEFNERKDRVAMWYDWQWVLYLQWDDSVINMGWNEYWKIFNNPNATDYEKQKAVDDWYNATKDLFTVERLPSSYNSLYNEDTLNTLAWNNVSRWSYTPTKDEWIAYITSLEDNVDKRNEIYKKYWLLDSWNENRHTIDLTSEASNKWFNWYEEYAWGNWLDEKINSKLYNNPEAILKAKAYYDENVVREQSSRIYPYISQVYALEQVALSKAPKDRNYWDQYIIDTANVMRKLEKLSAQNWNNWMSQVLEYWVDEDGNIIDSIDTFEGWQSLWDVLTNWMLQAAGLEADFRWKHASQIDIIAYVANDWIYNYYKDNLSGRWRKGWNNVEKFLRPMWDNLSELGQFTVWWTLHWLNAITWNWRSPTAAYLDQDASMARLIETDDWTIKRTIKKYTLQFGEYAPEWVFNLAPDILLSLLSWWWTLIKWGQKLWQLGKWLKWFKTVQNISKSSKIIDGGIRWLERIGALWDELANVNKWWKIWAKILDNTVTQIWLWQLMDGQWSAYDTEPYSNASFALSMWWSILFDALPELKSFRWAIFKPRGSTWNLVDYIASSPEAADNIARALWKKHPEFSFEEIKQYASIFGDVEAAAEQVWKQLPPEAKNAANQRTKQLMYNYVSQAYWANSTIARNIREIVTRGSLNPADILKYFWAIPWEVSLGPYVSSIKLKNGTRAALLSTEKWGWYNEVLDTLEWWFDSKLRNWFSEKDLEDLWSLSWYKFVNNERDKLFEQIWDKYYLTDIWLERFNLEKRSIPLESLWLTLESAENTRNILKEKMKNLAWKNISDETIEALADSWGYDAVVEKVKEVLWC